MTDTALIENGVVTQVWRETEAASLAEAHPDRVLHEFPSGSAVCGMVWDGVTLANPPPPALTKADLAAYAADKRYRVMCSGISFGGVTIPGDDISQLRIGRARDDLASHVLTEPISVNLGLVSIQATAEQITAIANGLSVKTQAAWTVQGTVIAAINAETITTTAQIDAAPWPSNG